MFNILRAEMARINITAADLAQHVGITPLTIAKKMNREVEWNLKEMIAVRERVAPSMSLDELFSAERASLYETSEAFFASRLESAFPEVMIGESIIYTEPLGCVRRLKDFFRTPLKTPSFFPITLAGAREDKAVRHFQTDSKETVDINEECPIRVKWIGIYRSSQPSRSFLFIHGATTGEFEEVACRTVCPENHPFHEKHAAWADGIIDANLSAEIKPLIEAAEGEQGGRYEKDILD